MLKLFWLPISIHDCSILYAKYSDQDFEKKVLLSLRTLFSEAYPLIIFFWYNRLIVSVAATFELRSVKLFRVVILKIWTQSNIQTVPHLTILFVVFNSQNLVWSLVCASKLVNSTNNHILINDLFLFIYYIL